MFKIKFRPKAAAIFVFSFLDFEEDNERYKEIEINKKRTFQTIGKTMLGGVIEGFIEPYHSKFVFPEVKILPINPNEKVTIMHRKRSFRFKFIN